MTESLALSPQVRPQGGFLAEKRGQWQAGPFGGQNVDEPSVAIVVAGSGFWVTGDLSLRYEQRKRMLTKAMEKQQRGRPRRRERQRHDVNLHDDRESSGRVYVREGQDHYVAVPPHDRLLSGIVGSWTLHDEWTHRVMQDVSLPSPYSFEEREPSEVKAVRQLWRRLAIDEAAAKLSSPLAASVILDILDPPSPELKVALHAIDGVQNEARLEGGVVPTVSTIARARGALKAIYSVGTWPSAVYPLPDGEVGIELETPRGSSFVFICEADGSAHCLFGMWGEVEEKRYTAEEVRSDLPDEFLRTVLGRLPR